MIKKKLFKIKLTKIVIQQVRNYVEHKFVDKFQLCYFYLAIQTLQPNRAGLSDYLNYPQSSLRREER